MTTTLTTKRVARKPLSQKPSGPITYTVHTGVNVFPGGFLSDRASVRVRDGELVIFREPKGIGRVAVSIGGRDTELARAEWEALPVHQG